jgi:hypothetical protein
MMVSARKANDRRPLSNFMMISSIRKMGFHFVREIITPATMDIQERNLPFRQPFGQK